MVSMLESSLARTIASAASFIFLDATLERDVPGTITDPADPPAPTQVTYSCKAIEDTYSTGERSGGLVSADDVKVLILAATLSVVPLPGDRITIRGVKRQIVPMGTAGLPGVKSDPARATWECRTRT
jgi:hypothetical protein